MKLRDLLLFGKARNPSKLGEMFAGGEYSGVFVGHFLDASTAAALALPDAIPAEELHVTLAYGGQAEEVPDAAIMRAITEISSMCQWLRPMTGAISGVGRFQAEAGEEGAQDVVIALVDVPYLSDAHEAIRRTFEACGLPCSDHGFTPHVTLAFIPPGAPLPVEQLPPLAININALTINAGKFSTTIALGAGLVEPAVLGEGPGDSGRLFLPYRFVEAAEWIPYLPIPGVYQHPRMGEMNLSRERLAHFVEVFRQGVYQKHIPLDAEHETKISGAVGWIEDLRQNADGSVDARVEWTDRGRQLLAENRYKYVSAEYWNEWDAPTGEHYTDVVIGGAICTRPFFKESVLRPLAASEEHPPKENAEMADPTAATETSPVTLAEMQTQLAEERSKREAAETRLTEQAAATTKLTEQVESLTKDRRTNAFTAEVTGKSAESHHRWFGDVAAHVGHLEALSVRFGEDSPEVKHYVDLNRTFARAAVDAVPTSPLGVAGSSTAMSDRPAASEMETKITKLREGDPSLSYEAAYTAVADQTPGILARIRAEGSR